MADDEFVVRSPYPDIPLPEDVSLPEVVLRKAVTYGDRVAYIDDKTGKVVTYTEFVSACHKLAAGLYHHGLAKGDVVAIYSDNSLEYPVIFLAITLCGGVATGIMTSYTDSPLKQVLTNANARFVFTTPALVEKVHQFAHECLAYQEIIVVGELAGYTSYDKLMNNNLDLPKIPVNAGADPCFITYSSGTTGVKKGVVSSHWALMAPCLYFEHHPDISFVGADGEIVLMARPMTHTYGQAFFITCGPYLGTTSILLSGGVRVSDDRQVEHIFKLIEKYKVTLFPFTPLPMAQWTKFDDYHKYDVSSVNRIAVGGSPLSNTVQKRFNKMFPVKYFKQGYGLSETTAITITPDSYDKNGPSVGVLMPGTCAKVIDLDTQKTLGPMKSGEIWFKGPTNMLRYLDMAKATADTLTPDGYIKTGDIGYYDEEGYFFIVDRLKEIICYDAYKIAPFAIETILLGHPDILEVGVVGYPDEDYGELPRAYLVKKPGSQITENDVHACLKGKINDFMSLRGGVVFVDYLPKTSIGKVMKKEIKIMMMKEYELEKGKQ